MSSVPAQKTDRDTTAGSNGRALRGNSPRKGRTSHLKEVPPSRPDRDQLRTLCQQTAAQMDKRTPLSKNELEAVARQILDKLNLGEGYVGWTMVVLSSEFWRDQVAAVPPSRRLLLLPHCLKHAEGCPADYDQYGLECERCGACCIADFRTRAEELGYKVLVAEGSPIVLKIIISGHVDAIVGVACLNVLEKAINKVLLAGIPCMAVPLLSSDCRNTSVDEDWVREMIEVRQEPPTVQTRSYLHLMRAARRMFEPEELERLVPKKGGPKKGTSHERMEKTTPGPFFGTESLAHEYLAKGGKYARPFITLSAYDALNGNRCTDPDGKQHTANIPDVVRRVALSIETFHKASLVHDDIEDDDAFRYGEPTLHRTHGLATAINVGDYLIGLGYRLVSREAGSLGAEVAGEILDRLADAHLRLSEGQGAELLWRDARDKQLSPLDALKIYALKTAPAFEAALLCGLRCAGPLGELEQPLKQLSKHLGIAFQILNDLKDWQGDHDNKLAAGLDTLGGRPTLLWALALQSLDEDHRNELLRIVSQQGDDSTRLARVRELYQIAGAFEQAERLVDKYQQRAEAIADKLQPESLRRLLYYLLDTVLERPAVVSPKVVML